MANNHSGEAASSRDIPDIARSLHDYYSFPERVWMRILGLPGINRELLEYISRNQTFPPAERQKILDLIAFICTLTPVMALSLYTKIIGNIPLEPGLWAIISPITLAAYATMRKKRRGMGDRLLDQAQVYLHVEGSEQRERFIRNRTEQKEKDRHATLFSKVHQNFLRAGFHICPELDTLVNILVEYYEQRVKRPKSREEEDAVVEKAKRANAIFLELRAHGYIYEFRGFSQQESPINVVAFQPEVFGETKYMATLQRIKAMQSIITSEESRLNLHQ